MDIFVQSKHSSMKSELEAYV